MSKDLYRHTHSSILAFISAVAEQFTLDFGQPFTAINLEAYASPEALPSGNLVAVDRFSITSSSDDLGIPTCSAMVVVGVEGDPNNLILSKVASRLFDRLQPENKIPLVNADTGLPLGMLQLMGPVLALPVDRESQTRAMVPLTLQAGVALI